MKHSMHKMLPPKCTLQDGEKKTKQNKTHKERCFNVKMTLCAY